MDRLLVLSAVWPEPKSSAAGSRMLQLLTTFLEADWSVMYASTAAPSEFAADLEAMGIDSVEVRVNDERFDVFLEDLAPDAVLFDRFFMEEQFGWRVERVCPDALRVLDGEDLHGLRDARERALGEGRALSPAHLAGPVARREVAAIFRSDLTLVISDYEMSLLTEHYGVAPALLHECPLMVDVSMIDRPRVSDQKAASPSMQERSGFLSIGNFRHPPNVDAVQWLKVDIWPQVRAALPSARLTVAGAYPSKEHLALADPRSGFDVVGRVDSVDDCMRSARVCLAPLRFGAGQKGKLVDAMRNGTPSVTTPIGAEGMGGESGWPGGVATDAESLAKAAVDLYEDALAWSAAQTRGFELLHRRFDRNEHAPALIGAVCAARESLPCRREANLIGAVLRDQHHRSTEYLSRWIEAKSKLAAREKREGESRG